MTTYLFDLNATCTGCGRLGATENGLCLTCNGVNISSPVADGGGREGAGSEGEARPRLDRAQRPTGRGLAGTLFDLILRVEKLDDRKFHLIPLPKGLRVEVGLGDHFNLRLSRADSTPSIAEWDTIVRYLPAAYQPGAPVEPRSFKHHSGHYYLEAYWPFQSRSG